MSRKYKTISELYSPFTPGIAKNKLFLFPAPKGEEIEKVEAAFKKHGLDKLPIIIFGHRFLPHGVNLPFEMGSIYNGHVRWLDTRKSFIPVTL